MSEIIALDAGFPGAGRIVKELSKISGVSEVRYFNLAKRSGLDIGVVGSPSLIFLPAWNPEIYPQLIRRFDGVKICVVWSSPLIQSEFTPVELDFLEWILRLLDQGKIHALWAGSPEWLSFIKKEGRKIFFCPYPVTLPEKWKHLAGKIPPKDVSLFGPLSPRKNVLTQAIAVKLAGHRLHITDNSAIPLLEKVGVDFEAHGWLPEDRYGSLVESMDIGLQVSVPGVESMSYVVWDHLSRDVPCLTSVRWAPYNMIIDQPFNPENIVEELKSNASDNYVTGAWRKWAERFAEERNREVKATLKQELGLDL